MPAGIRTEKHGVLKPADSVNSANLSRKVQGNTGRRFVSVFDKT